MAVLPNGDIVAAAVRVVERWARQATAQSVKEYYASMDMRGWRRAQALDKSNLEPMAVGKPHKFKMIDPRRGRR